jgi:hypothetical protein
MSDVHAVVLEKAARLVNRWMLAVISSDRRCWCAALIAEQHQIRDPFERFAWAIGGIRLVISDAARLMVRDPAASCAGAVLGTLSAILDLQSATRMPYVLAVFACCLVLALWRPRWAWRWTLLISLALPVAVLVTGNWGPYTVDRFDVFYGVVPAMIGTLIGKIARPFIVHKNGRRAE